MKNDDANGERDRVSRRGFLGRAGVALASTPLLLNDATASTAPLASAGDTAAAAPAEGMIAVTLEVNGTTHTLEIEPRVTLLDALRERLAMTGSKKGCDHGQCGACTVIVDGRRVYSCLALACMQDGKKITTVEGLANGETLHPVQAAFLANDGFQCGYCTSGQICAAVALLDEVKRGTASAVTPDMTRPPALAALDDAEIRERMAGNVCRCGAYNGIVEAVRQAWRNV
jgi:xanthine dehydrogenase YagT iron-sulfur-binding subunit